MKTKVLPPHNTRKIILIVVVIFSVVLGFYSVSTSSIQPRNLISLQQQQTKQQSVQEISPTTTRTTTQNVNNNNSSDNKLEVKTESENQDTEKTTNNHNDSSSPPPAEFESIWKQLPNYEISNVTDLFLEHFLTHKNFSQQHFEFCQEPRNCYNSYCMAPVDYFAGGCLPSQFHTDFIEVKRKQYSTANELKQRQAENAKWVIVGPTSKKVYPVNEFDCPSRKDDRQKYFHSSTSSTRNKRDDPLYKFKKHTSFMFRKWYDWGGTCVNKSLAPNEDFGLRGFHSPKDSFYRLQNVCVRPSGALRGYFNNRNTFKFDRYLGTNDASLADGQWENSLHHGLQKAHIEQMQKPADCYLDTKVVLMPIASRSDNPGHAFHRAGSLLRVIEIAFGEQAMRQSENVTVWYHGIWEKAILNREAMMKHNGFHLFYDILGTSWMSTYDHKWHPGAASHWRSGDDYEDIYGFRFDQARDWADPELQVCFKEVVVWQDAFAYNPGSWRFGYERNREGMDADANILGRQTSFNIHGPRSRRNAETLQLLDSRLRQCRNVPPRRSRARLSSNEPVRVVLLVRSQNRRFTLQPQIIDFLANSPNGLQKYFKHPGSTIEVLEHSTLHYRDVIERYSDFDVAIGMYGAALVWTAYMPPAAVVVELATFPFGYGFRTGVNVPGDQMPPPGASGKGASLNGEYWGSAIMAQQYHLKLCDINDYLLGRYPVDSRMVMDTMAGPDHFFEQLILKPASCLLKQEVVSIVDLNNFRQLPPPPECDVSPQNYKDAANFQLRTDFQTKSKNIARVITTRQPASGNSKWYSYRLETVLKNRDTLTPIVYDKVPIFYTDANVVAEANSQHNSVMNRQHPHWLRFDRTLLIVEPCEARAHAMTEASVFRQLMAGNLIRLIVAEYSLGREVCEELKRRTGNNTDAFPRLVPQKDSLLRSQKYYEGGYEHIGYPLVMYCDYNTPDRCVTHAPTKKFHLVLFDYAYSTGNNNQNSSLKKYKLPTAKEIFERFSNRNLGVVLGFDMNSDIIDVAGSQ